MNELARTIRIIFSTCLSLALLMAWMLGFAYSGSNWAIIPFYAWYVLLTNAASYYHLFGYGIIPICP